MSCMADFHAQMELLKLIWKLHFDTDAPRFTAGLYACRNLLDTRNVTKDGAKSYYANMDLLETVMESFLVVGMCHAV